MRKSKIQRTIETIHYVNKVYRYNYKGRDVSTDRMLIEFTAWPAMPGIDSEPLPDRFGDRMVELIECESWRPAKSRYAGEYVKRNGVAVNAYRYNGEEFGCVKYSKGFWISKPVVRYATSQYPDANVYIGFHGATPLVAWITTTNGERTTNLIALAATPPLDAVTYHR